MAPRAKDSHSRHDSDASFSEDEGTPSNNNRHHNGRIEAQRQHQSSAGTISSIELFDFMCHRHLLINLCPNINFVIGNNGSGKSAILTALTVCLGGRASVTQRGSSLESLIREGAQSAKVRIRMNNDGEKAFQPEVYGDQITIERVFRRDGQNGYSIISASKKTISNRKDTINAICDHFGLQVDNPLAVLTQETAKKFLANARPKDLYEFFMKATQLEQLSIDYNFAYEKLAESKLRLDHSKQALAPLGETIKRLEKQMADLERLKTIHQTIQSLRCEMTWALVEAKEAEERKLSLKVDKETQKLNDLDTQIEGYQRKITSLLDQMKEMEKEVADETAKVQPSKIEEQRLTQQLHSAELALQQLLDDGKQMKAQVASFQGQLEELDERIASERRKEGDAKSTKLRQRLAEIDGEFVEHNKAIAEAETEMETIQSSISPLESEIEAIREQQQEKNRQLQNCRAQLTNKKSSLNDNLKVYGENMPAALAEVSKAIKDFTQPPIGPLGRHIKLKDKRWSLALHAILNRNIASFLVNSHQDRVLLQGLLQKFNLYNPIIVLKFQGTIDVAAGRADRRFLTAMDLLDVDNVVVHKALIINCELEKLVMVEDRHEAMNIIRQRPPNVKAVFTYEHRRTAGSRSINTSSLFEDSRLPKLGEDVGEAIRRLEDHIVTLERACQVLSRDLNVKQENLGKIQSSIEVYSRRIASSRRSLDRLREEAKAIKDELRAMETFSQSVYEEERSRVEECIRSLTAQISANTEEQRLCHAKVDALKRQSAEIRQAIKDFESLHEESLERISDSVKLKLKFEKEVEKHNRMRSDMALQVNDSKVNLQRLTMEVEEMRSQATQLSPRVRVTRSIVDLDRELAANEECLRDKQRTGLDPLKVRRELDEKRSQFADLESSIIVNENLIKSLQTSLEHRQRAWEDFRRSVSKLSSMEFIMMMGTRGFQGSLEYRHHAAELHIKVVPQGQQVSSVSNGSTTAMMKKRKTGSSSDDLVSPSDNRDIKQLSGGEKSYSTACFLFSLWQAMGSPIRCLDEFDVYMDPVNRNFVLTLLVQHARSSKVQFILITPNAIPESYRSAQDVRIHRLRDPERTQSTIV